MKDLVIVGCGGFGREVLDVVDAINDVQPQWRVLGFVDDAPTARDIELVNRRSHSILGGVSDLAARSGTAYIIGIGSGHVRRAISETLDAAGLSPATLVHPSATLGGDTRIGDGSVLCAGVRVTTNVHLGQHVHLNLNTTVGHDTRLSDFVTVNPLVAISGAVEIGEESTLGTHSAVLQGLALAPRTFVGAGACVTRHVPDPGTLVVGVPAKPIRKGERL